jgi:hypothetical protein
LQLAVTFDRLAILVAECLEHLLTKAQAEATWIQA